MIDKEQTTETLIERVHRLQQVMAARDVNASLEFFAPNVEYHYHFGTRPLIGIEWVEKFLKKYWANHTDVTWVINSWAENDGRLFSEGEERYVNADGHQVIHPYMGVIEFTDGLITGWRDYFQMADPNAGK